MLNTNETYLTEMKHQQSENLHTFSTREIIELMNEEDMKVPFAIKKALPQIEKAVDIVVETLEKGGKVFYFGAGTSGRLGVLDASECPPTFGVKADLVNGIIAGGEKALQYAVENAEDNFEAGKEEVDKYVSLNDIVIGIASSGKTPFVLGALENANERGIPTIGIACNENSQISSLANFSIEIPVGPEIITGSTRLKAGTAQKMVLNMISTASMIKAGKIYKNLMVNVQATNDKLRKRSISIIEDITGVDSNIARQMNDMAKGDTRVAILMILFEIDKETAKEKLEKSNDNFPRAMEDLQKQSELG